MAPDEPPSLASATGHSLPVSVCQLKLGSNPGHISCQLV